ncbi:TetR/AcrR family transcriptional regulator [Lacisediminihabitans profunda]|uniref:TetR family transcriptional regulator n=1 Tax=Lacisediminihabitans profunda TaxID=2594790 RepID=A0A5C8UQV1_9MICO|nr:TetR/AcrR family transcriptional regulator [Lacisediminihabitans profunda]TXN29920.1 TetR family transcriptional regulator [Lacisediminihabitans profunda]
MTHPTDAGLRARKRAATQSTIERAALSLALEHGYDGVTVDAICEASMVSQRTFFNYFGSKEGVILGPPPPMPTDAAVEAFVHAAGHDVLGDLVSLLAAAIADGEPDRDLFRSRRVLIQRTPELMNREVARMTELQTGLVAIVLARLRASGRADSSGLTEEARMIVVLAGSVMRYCLEQYFSGTTTGNPREVLENALALVRRITNGS